MTALTLQLPAHLQFTDDEFLQIVATNTDLPYNNQSICLTFVNEKDDIKCLIH